VVWCS